MMLSKKDIFRELGKELSIHPLITENIKENSVNISTSEHAWTQEGGTVYWYGGKDFRTTPSTVSPKRTHTFKPGQKSIFITKNRNGEGKNYLILFPHQTTNVESLEVIGIGKRLGGAVHSKVGIVIKGIGDCGTMLGPGYCGHLLISLHNMTNNIIVLEIGETFASLTFEYLKTPVIRDSDTVTSHKDKLLEMNYELSYDDHVYFSEDWKSNFGGVCRKMKSSDNYKKFIADRPMTIISQVKDFFNWRNIVLICIALVFLVGLYYGAYKLDSALKEPIWVDRYYNVVIVAVVAAIFSVYGKLFKK